MYLKPTSLLVTSFTYFFFAVAISAQNGSIEYRSYLAHIAAASNALRVNETGEARRWIDAAPVKYRGWEWSFLNAQTSQFSASRTLHTAPVTAVPASPDGKLLASASSDRTIKVTDAASGAEVLSFKDEKLAPQSVAFTLDGKRLAAAFSRHTVIVWDVTSKSEIRRFQGQGKGITAVAFSPDGSLVAACSWNVAQPRGVWGIVEIWDAATGESVKATRVWRKAARRHRIQPGRQTACRRIVGGRQDRCGLGYGKMGQSGCDANRR
ncbi:MAG: hypothetical protein IPG58_14045 [Acidobacteria bacterium]|nr:hypothetical protein [Acidobacteriota bacterium]